MEVLRQHTKALQPHLRTYEKEGLHCLLPGLLHSLAEGPVHSESASQAPSQQGGTRSRRSRCCGGGMILGSLEGFFCSAHASHAE